LTIRDKKISVNRRMTGLNNLGEEILGPDNDHGVIGWHRDGALPPAPMSARAVSRVKSRLSGSDG
jgi:hypothetical protein